MVKTMCNICGKNTIDSSSIHNRVLGKVCTSCLNQIKMSAMHGTNSGETQTQVLALQSVVEKDIEKHPYNSWIFEAIQDSLSRYRMELISYNNSCGRIQIRYRGEYRRAEVIIEINTDQYSEGGGVAPVVVTVYNAKNDHKVYVERTFGV